MVVAYLVAFRGMAILPFAAPYFTGGLEVASWPQVIVYHYAFDTVGIACRRHFYNKIFPFNGVLSPAHTCLGDACRRTSLPAWLAVSTDITSAHRDRGSRLWLDH